MGQAGIDPRTRSVQLGNLTFEVDTYDAEAHRETVIMLHGFPQDMKMWKPVASVLAAKGYAVHAINQRGYSPGAQPRAVSSYNLRHLASDIKAFVDAESTGPVHLVGHDWGGSVVWQFAATWPEELASVAVLSMPHPSALRRSGGLAQAVHSLYILPLLIPPAMRLLLNVRNSELARLWLKKMGMTENLADKSIALLRRPGVLEGSLRWYQALPIDIARFRDVEQISAPSLYVWGSRDAAVTRGAAEATLKYLSHGDFVETNDSHWLVDESPATIAGLLVTHFEKHPAKEGPGR